MRENPKILIVRFKQIGDAIISSSIASALKEKFPKSEIHYVLYEHIAPLFDNHPDIDKVISLSPKERKNPFLYFKKVYSTIKNDYDIIIDIIATPKSELFTFLGRKAPYRIGRKKRNSRRGYTYNYQIRENKAAPDKIAKFLDLLKPLENEGLPIKEYKKRFYINLLPGEVEAMKEKMVQNKVDFDTYMPIVFSINSRRPEKVWKKEHMKELIKNILDKYPVQIIFFYSPNEKEYALEMHRELGFHKQVISSIETKNIRELASLIANTKLIVGNDGGPIHIARSLGLPGVVIFSPSSPKREWLILPNDTYQGIEYYDCLSPGEIDILNSAPEDRKIIDRTLFDSIHPSDVLKVFDDIYKKIT